MLNSLFHILRCRMLVASVAAVVLAVSTARAQSGFGDIIYTVATTTTDTNGRPWAYILWQATTPGLLSGRTFAVYSKPGEATNNAPYVRLTVVQLQTDARSIEPLLRRSENIGEKSWQLQQDMMQLFANLMPSNSISRADQLSAVIRGSLVDDGHYRNLVLLARNHPGVALCMGFADAELVSTSKTTFEIRNFDLAKNQDVAVVGRVTVDTGSPDTLPAPGSPVLMPDPSPRGDINLKFRWGTPDSLRRLGLLHFGYNLWRVPKAYAEASSNKWDVMPPALGVFAARALTESNIVKRVNRVPIVPGKIFTLTEATNVYAPTGDSNTMFIADDDGRFRPGYTNYGFTNGAKFYYFATARDILARDGQSSLGTLATVCDRMPPPVPMGVRVINDYSYDTATLTSQQALRVIWNQVTNTTDIVSNYWIYRWTSVTQMNALSGNISNNLIAVVPHSGSWKTNSFLDVGPTSPTTTNFGQTFWYTVRAGDCAACGQNLSGNSGPAYGVLRQRVGPQAPTAVIDWNCPDPWLDYVRAFNTTVQGPASNYNFNVTCVRSNSQFAWAHFAVIQNIYDPQNKFFGFVTNDLGLYFFGLNNTVNATFSYPTQVYASTTFYCQAGTYDGKLTLVVAAPTISEGGLPLPSGQMVMEVDFSAHTILNRVNDAKNRRIDGPCRSHDPIDPGTGLITPINICIYPTAGSKEWRLYQRVDDGPLTLYGAGAVTNGLSSICIPNDSVPANPGTLCFYGQVLDVNGNASPLVRFGCLDIGTADQLPTPLLASISSSGDTNSPGMNLVWFCPPSGLDRFEVWIGVKQGSPPPPQVLSSQLSFSNGLIFSQAVTNSSTNETYTFYEYRTPHIGQSFGNGTPQFLVNPTIEIGRSYAVLVKAVGKHGGSGPASNIETFQWKKTNAPGPKVPWPARPLPTTNTTFGGFAWFLAPSSSPPGLASPDNSVAVLIGACTLRESDVTGQRPIRLTAANPSLLVATNPAGASLFPVVLYRYQTPNVNFPTVSGDVIQVSPLMEKIAYGFSGIYTYIYDPFITVTQQGLVGYIWLLDTQPQISGATYKYLIVRFGANREIEEIIPTNEVPVP